MNLANFDMDLANNQLSQNSVEERLQWAIDYFDQIVISSSFGLQTGVIIDVVYRRLKRQLPVIFLDTLYHFSETHALAGRFLEKYDLNLQIIRPPDAKNRTEFENKYGHRLWERDIERFHELTKLRQIETALKHRDAWITGIRRDQSQTRKSARVLEWDRKFRLFKINPLVDWTKERVLKYVRKNGVPYNSLFDKGYQSIGDEPLTDPVQNTESERAGRWRGTNKTECGLHI